MGLLTDTVAAVVDSIPIVDLHTHLFDPCFGPLCSAGIDDLLTYHYLVAETLRLSPLSVDAFQGLEKVRRAEHVWETLFVRHSPLSEVTRAVLTVLGALGIDPNVERLDAIREAFARLDPARRLDDVFRLSGVAKVVMTNDPFDPVEGRIWRQNPSRDPRFLAALRLDVLLLDEARAEAVLTEEGMDVAAFLRFWMERMDARYCAVSLPPTFALSDRAGRLIDQVVLPVCRDLDRPLALMMGVRRAVNPRLQMAGDGVGRADLGPLEQLCARHPENRIMATVLSLENQHELIVLARKFPNLLPFGCWWFVNNPTIVAPLTRLRLEMLGTSFVPQHSDCRVLEQLISKWAHFKPIFVEVMAEAYERLSQAGWRVSEDLIRRDLTPMLAPAI
jgi:hypothetical protein